MSHGLSIKRVSPLLRLTIVVLTMVLTAAVPGRSLAEEPAARSQVGQRVVPKQRDFTLRDTEGGPKRAAKIAIYRVDQVDGGFLKVKGKGGRAGWAEVGQVVPIEQADAFFTKAIKESPSDPHNHTMRAIVALFEHEDVERALADCDLALALDPTNTLAYGIRGAARTARQDFSRAQADFSEVIRLKPGDPDAYRDRGVARKFAQDFDGAIADFDQAIRIDPNNTDAYFLRATVRGQNGELDQAIADFTQLIKLDPHIPLAFEARGSAWRHKNEYERAIADFSEAIRLDPTSAGSYIARAIAWHEQQQHDKAVADLDQAIKLDPQNEAAYGVRAGAWISKKELTKAIDDFTQLLKLDPANVWAYANRGLALAELKQFDKAVADLDRAMELDPQNPDALNGCAWFRATCPVATYRDGSQALKAATKACELTEWRQPGLLDTLAAAHAESGDFDSAVKCQAKAIELETNAAEKTEFNERLRLYKSKKPYRETKP